MTFFKISLRAILLVACIAVLIPGANAQYRAGVQGSVVDSQGASVSGALVTLKNQETNISKQFTTGDDGVYSFTGLPPAQYTIIVEKQGFKKKTIDKVAISAEETRGINVTMDVAAAAGDSALADRTWVLLTEAPEGGWGLSGHANTNGELVSAARAQIAQPSRSSHSVSTSPYAQAGLYDRVEVHTWRFGGRPKN